MRLTTTATFSIASGKLLRRSWYEYDGVVARLKGASAAETNLANTQAQFYNTVLQNYNTQFANQSSILSSLTSGWNQTFNAGINQYGFSPAEDTAMRTQASEGTAKTYNQALTALNQQIGARGGGNNNSGVVSGADQQLAEQVAAAGAADISGKQLGITESGYSTGRQNYLAAAGALGQTAQLYNPQGYGQIGNQAGSEAFNQADTVQKENAAASPWNVIAPILGGVAGSFLGPVGTAIGSKLGSALTSGGSSAAGDSVPGDYNPDSSWS